MSYRTIVVVRKPGQDEMVRCGIVGEGDRARMKCGLCLTGVLFRVGDDLKLGTRCRVCGAKVVAIEHRPRLRMPS